MKTRNLTDRARFLLLSFLIVPLFPTLSFGWGDIGHSATAEIAERALTPLGRSFVFDLMGPEPLPVSAVFPDQVRSDDRYKLFKVFHFLEIPGNFSAYPYTIPNEVRAVRDAGTIIDLAPTALLGRELTLDQKRVLFRYLVHVVGDVHQPLHIGNGLDIGANLCLVKWHDHEDNLVKQVDLHTVWDEKIILNISSDFTAAFIRTNTTPGRKAPYFTYRSLAEMILREVKNDPTNPSASAIDANTLTVDPQILAASLIVGTPNQWYQESKNILSEVYPDAIKGTAPESRAYCQHIHKIEGSKFIENLPREGVRPDSIPFLNPDYILNAKKITKKQVWLGGIRLASLINQIAVMRQSGVAVPPIRKPTLEIGANDPLSVIPMPAPTGTNARSMQFLNLIYEKLRN